MLNPSQINLLLELIQRRTVFFAGSTLGPELLSDQEKQLLVQNGIDVAKLYDPSKDLVNLNFHLGMLSNILSQTQTQAITYEDLRRYVQSGQYIPLNKREQATIANIKMQSMADIRANSGKIFQDVNNVVSNELSTARANQEEFLREQIIEGTEKRESRRSIARNIARLTGDWSRNFIKSVQYISHTALNEGRAAMVHRRHGDNEKGRVYFLVQKDACSHCITAYLTGPAGSEPKIFTLRELEANGSNIGRKAKEWKPTVVALHVNCRCLLTEYIEGQVWDGTKFVWPAGQKEKPSSRPKIRIWVNGEEHWV